MIVPRMAQPGGSVVSTGYDNYLKVCSSTLHKHLTKGRARRLLRCRSDSAITPLPQEPFLSALTRAIRRSGLPIRMLVAFDSPAIHSIGESRERTGTSEPRVKPRCLRWGIENRGNEYEKNLNVCDFRSEERRV